MTLGSIYKQSILRPSYILLSITSICSPIYYYYQSQLYVSFYEWYETLIIHLILTIIYCLLIALTCVTIFLNKFEKISSNARLSLLSWFLFPSIFICSIIAKAFFESSFEIICAFVANIPFIIYLTIGFRKFKALNID